jgi:hypothetical protein
MASTPLWVPLVVAAFGVAGTFLAAFYARKSADKREDQRWTREREAEESRWRRERDERREQWEREDHARWLAERRIIYAEYLQRLDAWRLALVKAEVEARRNAGLSRDSATELEHLYASHNKTYETISLLAPAAIVDMAATCSLTLGFWTDNLVVYFDRDGSEKREENSGYERDIYGQIEHLGKAIRQDLGVDSAES